MTARWAVLLLLTGCSGPLITRAQVGEDCAEERLRHWVAAEALVMCNETPGCGAGAVARNYRARGLAHLACVKRGA